MMSMGYDSGAGWRLEVPKGGMNQKPDDFGDDLTKRWLSILEWVV